MEEYLLVLSILALGFIVWQDFFYKKPILMPHLLRQCLFILTSIIYALLASIMIYNTITEWHTTGAIEKLINVLISIGWISLFWRHLTQKSALAKKLWKK